MSLFDTIRKHIKLVAGLTLTATVLAVLVSLVRPKEYLSTVTALPANSLTTDKARIFNGNIEALYSELGGPDELDRIEGTAQLDTIFLAVAQQQKLAAHYAINSEEATQQAADRLRKLAHIRRSAYGELKIGVWDKDAAMAALLANALLNELNELHRHIRTSNYERVLQALREGLQVKEVAMFSLEQQRIETPSLAADSATSQSDRTAFNVASQQQALAQHVRLYRELIQQYELALSTSQQPLIVVEPARPSLSPHRPKLVQNAAFAFGASLVFAVLLALFMESRSYKPR